MALPLTYTETWGGRAVREAVASTYDHLDAESILTFAGAEEALYWALQELVGPGDHALVAVPCYQSMETVTLATGAEVTPLPLRPENGWALDIQEVHGLLRPNTRLIAVNYPHNPTGYVPDEVDFCELAALCEVRDIRLFCDEVYRGVELDPNVTISQAADISETAVSLNVVSKSYGLPGLRVGWLACRDHELLARLEKRKHYTTICNAGPAEFLATIALRNRERIWERNRGIIAANVPLFDDFFERWADDFEWQPPLGGCVCYPQVQGRRRGGLLRPPARRRGRAGAAGEHLQVGDRRDARRPLSCGRRPARPRRGARGVRPLHAPARGPPPGLTSPRGRRLAGPPAAVPGSRPGRAPPARRTPASVSRGVHWAPRLTPPDAPRRCNFSRHDAV